jgi:hypothetical protein
MEGTYKRKIIDYLKKNTKKGYPIQTLRFALINQGYLRPLVDGAIEQAMKELAKEAPVLKETPKIEHEIIVDNTPIPVKKPWWKRLFGLR